MFFNEGTDAEFINEQHYREKLLHKGVSAMLSVVFYKLQLHHSSQWIILNDQNCPKIKKKNADTEENNYNCDKIQ